MSGIQLALLAGKNAEGLFAWSLPRFAYGGINFDFGVGGIQSVAFNDDGTKAYVANSVAEEVQQYSLSSAWDITTLTSDAVTLDVSGQFTFGFPFALKFKPDGTKFYLANLNNDEVVEYDVSSPWALSTASYSGTTYTSSEASNVSGLAFKSDGAKMYLVDGVADKVFQYTLSTAWDIFTASYDSVSFNALAAPLRLTFKPDGTRMYIGRSTDIIYQYDLGTPWDIGTVITPPRFLDVSSDVPASIADIDFRDNGEHLYVVSNNDLFQFGLV